MDEDAKKDIARFRFGGALIRLRKQYRGATLPTLLREAKARGIVPTPFRVSLATLYRFFKRQGLEEETLPVDRRRFEAELPNDIWQSDAMHGPKVRFEELQTLAQFDFDSRPVLPMISPDRTTSSISSCSTPPNPSPHASSAAPTSKASRSKT